MNQLIYKFYNIDAGKYLINIEGACLDLSPLSLPVLKMTMYSIP
jgi:hypothetical protein